MKRKTINSRMMKRLILAHGDHGSQDLGSQDVQKDLAGDVVLEVHPSF